MAGKKKNRVLNYFKEVKSELKKVVWPSFKQVKNNTLIVIACVLIIGAFIWILDAIFGMSLGKVVEKMQEPEAVEQQQIVQQGTDVQMPTEEEMAEFQKNYEEYLAKLTAAGIVLNEETNKFTDVETGAELTDEEVTARLETLETETDGTDATEETTVENPETDNGSGE